MKVCPYRKLSKELKQVQQNQSLMSNCMWVGVAYDIGYGSVKIKALE